MHGPNYLNARINTNSKKNNGVQLIFEKRKSIYYHDRVFIIIF